MENTTYNEEVIKATISKKVSIDSKGDFCCPNCGRHLPIMRRHKYCPECGQKLAYDDEAAYDRKWDPRYNRPRVLFDMDDCINGFTQHLIDVYNERTGSNVKVEDIKEWDLAKYIGEYGMSIFREEGFFEDIPEKKSATKTLKKLIESADYDVYIITACGTNQELEEKYKWFDKYLPEFNKDRIIKCKEKEIIHGDVLIDDNIENLRKCAPYMKCIIFDTPTNRNCTDDFPRVKSLKEVVPLLQKWFYWDK